MTLAEHALRGAVLSVGPWCRLAVGLPWFRSMPLSAVVSVALLVDGRAVPDLRVELDGRLLPVGELATLVDRYWFVQDRLTLAWSGWSLSGAVEVALRVRLHLPFLTGPGGGSLQVLQESRGTVPVEVAA
ncbi:hypothetical protein [Amnibacterium sp.]|uniref:hypothetical protein n=1 Tax=Amnibacterium sp. TaxID=1872496 RepID=UPI003F7C93ED